MQGKLLSMYAYDFFADLPDDDTKLKKMDRFWNTA